MDDKDEDSDGDHLKLQWEESEDINAQVKSKSLIEGLTRTNTEDLFASQSKKSECFTYLQCMKRNEICTMIDFWARFIRLRRPVIFACSLFSKVYIDPFLRDHTVVYMDFVKILPNVSESPLAHVCQLNPLDPVSMVT